ncbi:DUF6391 domain-containing protein [Caldilinea sp.]|uniref:DUF6391 domain-containing protein n=1 Tax=Caldilinea sp. TaxID=2293560 RepID=UPI002B84B6A9|nr:hypothetical protein [Anaerolineales bacterium]HQY91434.1 DUF6391 domain-containing protein [Caldilinea sp.]HRA66057.1 DUF6391 domain-containing protein [Caldilinea sp.]
MLTTLQTTLRRTRQHHAIEHATLSILAERFPERRMVGYSDPVGFTLLADVPEEAARRALADAMLRLQAGETRLAIHPNCGTNLLTTGVLVTLAALLGGAGARKEILSRFTRALILVLPALVISPGLGMRLQRYTTTAEVSDRWVKEVRPLQLGEMRGFRIIFA